MAIGMRQKSRIPSRSRPTILYYISFSSYEKKKIKNICFNIKSRGIL